MDPISDELQAHDSTEEDKEEEYAQQTLVYNNEHSSLDTCNVASAAHKKSEIHSERVLQESLMSPLPKITKSNRRRATTFEVHGSRVIRSNSRKDRHSKVCTTRGPKDRRVRLSPTTAIQFYDVQDRLGYDRPSKAIDWLMQEAKTAIDALNDSSQAFDTYRQHLKNLNQMEQGNDGCVIQKLGNLSNNADNPISSFGVFVNGDSATVPITEDFNSSRLYQEHEFLSALTSTSQILDANMEMARSQRIFTWNCESTNSGNSSLPLQYPLAPVLSHGQMFIQREPLQSSFNIINSESPRLNFYSDELSNFTLDESEKDAVPVTSNSSSAYFLHMDE